MSLVLTEPVNRTILLLDIEDYSRRDNVEQTFLRRGLHSVVEDVLAGAGVEQHMQYREDRGDGLIILVSPDLPKTALLRALLTTAPDSLRDYNRMASTSAQMRLRMVLASGEVAADPRQGTVGGLVGHDLNQACRLLDAKVLRDALQQRSADCVLGVSALVYEGTVFHGHRGLPPEDFHRVEVSVKKDRLACWLHGPLPEGTAAVQAADPGTGSGSGVPAAEAAPSPSPSPAGGTPVIVNGGSFNGSSFTVGGTFVAGNQTGVSGGHVAGDVVIGSTRSDDLGSHGV
jgi:hypothetical protein